MLSFAVALNGTSVCRAGVGKAGVLSTTVTWVGRSPKAERPGGRTKKGVTELRVGGLYTTKGDQVFVEWLTRALAPGDEVTLRVLEADVVDPPSSKTVQRRDWIERQEEAYYEMMKKKYEPAVSKQTTGKGRRHSPKNARSNQMQRTKSAMAQRRGPRR